MKNYLMFIFVLLICGCSMQSFDEYKYNNEIETITGKLSTYQEVSEWVCNNITYEWDKEIEEKIDYHSSPYETAKNGYGDCEDYAILFAYLLVNNSIYKLDEIMILVLLDGTENAHVVVELPDIDHYISPQSLNTSEKYEEWYRFFECSYSLWMYHCTNNNTKGL